MARSRDDFDAKTIDALSKRASYICSRPECRALTICPSTVSIEKYIYVGKAAHITAASTGGPRFDASLTSDERRSINNAIFLCSTCADMIDKNTGLDFTISQLREWKNEHEQWVRSNLNRSISSIISANDRQHVSKPIIDICHRGISVSEIRPNVMAFDIPYCAGKNSNALNVNLLAAVIFSNDLGLRILSNFDHSFPENINLSYETGKSIEFTLHPLDSALLPNIYISVAGTYSDESKTSVYTILDIFKLSSVSKAWVRTLGDEDSLVRNFVGSMPSNPCNTDA